MTDADQPETPIDPRQPTGTQSKHALMLAVELDLLRYREPFDTRREEEIARLREELGSDIRLPWIEGVYYLVYVTTEDGTSMWLLLPEGDVLPFVLGLATKAGVADKVQYLPGIIAG